MKDEKWVPISELPHGPPDSDDWLSVDPTKLEEKIKNKFDAETSKSAYEMEFSDSEEDNDVWLDFP
jgi:hypothetical protein